MPVGLCQCLKINVAKPPPCVTCAARTICPVKRQHDALLAKPPGGVNQRSIIFQCSHRFSSDGQWPTAEDISASLEAAGVIDLCRSGCEEAAEDTCETLADLEALREKARAHGWEVGFQVFSCSEAPVNLYQIGEFRLARNPPRGTAC